MNFQQFKEYKYGVPPGDCPWNPMGFNNDYTQSAYSEMSAHMPFLEFLARNCKHVTEFGTRDCNSTVAFLSGAREKVVSYDIQPTPSITFLLEARERGELPCKWEFKCQNTIDPNHQIEETDLLFIDTLHTFHQVQQELKLHGHRANKYIVFHDVFSQGLTSLDSPGQVGINPAIQEYIAQTECWKIVYQVPFNHGLLVIERIEEDDL